MLPFAILEQFHWVTIPISMFIVFALLGLELLAEEIEEPFGLDCNDLPTETMALAIRGNVHEILLEESHPQLTKKPNLYEKTH